MKQLCKKIFYSIICITCVSVVGVVHAYADGQSLSVTPPLFQLSVSPGDEWQSAIKVVNPNSYPLTVHAEVFNFEATGESGYGAFIPIDTSTTSKDTLAQWIAIDSAPQSIPAEKSQDISFIVHVPKDASPGGHYAAILISTEPSGGTKGQTVQTIQSVTSLFFLRVEGDVIERGDIREFRALDSVVNTPDVTLSLRFENKGNVHLQPKGDIIITNMWGTERGRIPVNYKSSFGNVLPQSIRDFTFSWKSDFRVSDIGRYTARTTLAYGENGVQSTDAITHFWVIPVKWTLITILFILVSVGLVALIVRTYIRKMLMLSGVSLDATHQESSRTIQTSYGKAALPITHGVLDLRTRLSDTQKQKSRITIYKEFVIQYRAFFLSVCALIGIAIIVTLYVRGATTEHRMYEVHVTDE